MERCGRYFSPAGPDDFDLCAHQSSGMAAILTGIGEAKLEDRFGLRAPHHRWLRYGIALWTEGGGIRLLGSVDVMVYSAYGMVRTRYDGFTSRYFGVGEPAAGFSHLGWRDGLWSTANVRPIVVSFAPTGSGMQRSSSYVPRYALVCRRTEIVVPGSPSRIEKAFIN